MKGTSQLIVFYVVSIAIAFFIGLRQSKDDKPAELASIEQLADGGVQSGKPGGRDDAANRYFTTSANAVGTGFSGFLSGKGAFQTIDPVYLEANPLTSGEIRNDLGPALLSDNLVNRNIVIADMLARLTPGNAVDVLRVFENTPPAYHTDNNYRLFLHSWAKVDGKAALDYIMNNPDAHRVGGGEIWAMSGWTQADPDEALEFVESREKPDHGLYHGLIRGWSRVNLQAASDYVEGLDDRRLKHRLVGSLGESYMEQKGVQGALNWVNQVAQGSEDKDFSQATFDDVIRRSAHRDATLVADWISANSNHGQIKPWHFEHTAGNLANSDPAGAASWLEGYASDDRVTGNAARRVISQWAEDDPLEASRWADSLRDTKFFNKSLTEGLVGVWAREDSSAALKWADTLELNLRRPALGRIVGSVPHDQLESMGDWIRNAPSENVMDGARAAYAHRMAEENPLEALDQALLMTDALGREKVTVGIAQRLYRQDPGSIRDWLPTSGLSEAAQQRVTRSVDHGNPKSRDRPTR
jgi:hypothetical protein